jgi:ATP-binding cassette, subfamily B, bacterial
MAKRPTSLTSNLPGLRQVLRRFAPYLRPHRGLLAGSVVALFGTTAMKLLEPWPLKFVLDRVVPAGTGSAGGGSGIAAVDALDPIVLLTLCAIGVVIVIGFRAAFQYLTTVGFAIVGNRVLTEVRNTLFRHLQALSLGFHTRAKAGDLTMRLIGDVGMLKETVVTAALPLAANLLILVGMIGVMLLLDWQLTLLALLPLPLLWLSSLKMGRSIQTISRSQRKREGDMAATAAETMAGMRTVQALAIEERAADIFVGANAKSLSEGVKAKRLAAGLERLVDVLVGVAIALVLWFGTLQVLRGRLTPGDLIVFLTYLKNSFRPVRSFAKYTARLAKATAAGERVIEILDELPGVADRPGAKDAPAFRGAVSFDNVRFEYGAAPVLDGVSVDIEPGSRVAVIGPSGTGKSTFASLILRLYDTTGGRVLIDGCDISEFTLKSLRAQISLVPQETLMFRASIAENIALGAGRDVTREEVVAAAMEANAHDFIENYETQVAERGATLSAGQRQRIAIARAILRKSPILILDEPTVGLDRTNRSAVVDAIWRLAEGRTTLLVTHDLDLAAQADRILFLAEGRITEDGTHADLVACGGRYAKLWRKQTFEEHAKFEDAAAV